MRPNRVFLPVVVALVAASWGADVAVAQPANDAPSRRHVLILNSYHKEFRWTDRQVEGAKQVLTEAVDNLELYVAYMDTKRLYTDAYLEQLRQTYSLKYGHVKLDAVITTDDNALRFAVAHHEQVFGSAPVFFCGINDYPSFSSLRHDLFTGLVEVLDIRATIDLIRTLHPGTRKIAVVVDNTPTGMGQRKEVAAAAEDYPDLEFEYLTGETYATAELLDRLANLPPDCVALLTVWLRDRNNEYAATDDVGELISARSSVPVYGIIDMYLGHGVVGGKLLNSETHGRLAAQMAVRVLNGESPSDIPVLLESHNPYMFDDRQLLRWGIDRAALPDDSVVVNARFSLYETYRTQIWGIAAAFVALVVVIAVLAVSIIRRKQAEAALRESEERHRGLTENIPQRIFHKNAHSVYVSCNRQYAEDMGIDPEQIAGKTDFDFYPSELAEKYRDDDRSVMEARKTTEIEETYIRGGEELTIQTVKTPLTDSAGRVTGILGIFWDITARKLAEKEREGLEAQLRQSQKMEAVGQLAGGIAHDFNNLLTAILGNIELGMDAVRLELGEDHRIAAALNQIEKAAQRAAVLTRQLLTFSRRDVVQTKSLNLNNIIADLDGLLRRLITENIALETSTDPDLHWVRADLGQIEQVVVNLVVNATQAMPDGGRLVLETRNVDLDKSYACDHADARPGPHVVLVVRDTGCGMDEATMARVFEPFFTTKPVDKGSGLGLATVHGIVKRAGGHVHVYSEPGQGATFEVCLPAAAHDGADVTSSGISTEAPRGTEVIMLCEDDGAVRDLVAESLRSGGYTVITAESGRACLDAAHARTEPIDLLITDVIMPDMNGRTLSEKIGSLWPGVPTLFISGYTSNVIAHHGVLDDDVEFLEKPFTRHDLLMKVRESLVHAATV